VLVNAGANCNARRTNEASRGLVALAGSLHSNGPLGVLTQHGLILDSETIDYIIAKGYTRDMLAIAGQWAQDVLLLELRLRLLESAHTVAGKAVPRLPPHFQTI
jgi:hypothetical protein